MAAKKVGETAIIAKQIKEAIINVNIEDIALALKEYSLIDVANILEEVKNYLSKNITEKNYYSVYHLTPSLTGTPDIHRIRGLVVQELKPKLEPKADQLKKVQAWFADKAKKNGMFDRIAALAKTDKKDSKQKNSLVKRVINAASYEEVSDEDLIVVSQLIHEQRVDEINARIDVAKITAEDVVKDLSKDAQGVVSGDVALKTRKNPESAVRDAAHVTADIAEEELTALEANKNGEIRNRIVNAQRRAELIRIKKELSSDDTFTIDGATPESMDSETLAKNLDKLAAQLTKKQQLDERAAAQGVEYSCKSIGEIDTALVKYETAILVGELGEIFGEKVTYAIVVDENRYCETKNIHTMTEDELKLVERQVEKQVTKNGTTWIYYNSDSVVEHIRDNAKTIASNVAQRLGITNVAAIADYLETIETIKIDAPIISETALDLVAKNCAVLEWRKKRLDDLKSTLKIEGDEIEGTKLEDLKATDVEGYIARATKLYTTLGVTDEDKLVVNASELKAIEKVAENKTYKNKPSYLKILLGAGFTATQAENIANNTEIAELAGLNGAAEDKDVSAAVKANKAKLKVMSNNPGKKWEELDNEILEFYKASTTTTAEKKQIQADYIRIIKNNVVEGGVFDDAVKLVVGEKRHGFDKTGLDLTAFADKLDKLDVEALEEIAKTYSEKSLDGQENIAKIRMIQAVIEYKKLAAEKGKSTAGKDKQEVRTAENDAMKAIDKYLLIAEFKELAGAIQQTITEGNLDRYATGDIKITDDKINEIRKKLEILRKQLGDFDEKIKKVKALFSKTGVDITHEKDVVEKAIGYEKALAPKVETIDEKMERAQAKLGDVYVTESRAFNIEFVKTEMKNNVGANKDAEAQSAIGAQLDNLFKDHTDSGEGYKDYYDSKYGEGAYDKMVSMLTLNGGLDNSEALKKKDKNGMTYFDRHAVTMATSIMVLLKNIRTQTKLTENDCRLYAHIQLMADVNSQELFKALEKVLGRPDIDQLKQLVIKKKITTLDEEAQFQLENIQGIVGNIVKTLAENGVDHDTSDEIVEAIKNAYANDKTYIPDLNESVVKALAEGTIKVDEVIKKIAPSGGATRK